MRISKMWSKSERMLLRLVTAIQAVNTDVFVLEKSTKKCICEKRVWNFHCMK